MNIKHVITMCIGVTMIAVIFIGIAFADGKPVSFPPTSRLGYQWESTTNTRSTTDILVACVATMAICVVTVVHTDIPPQTLGQRARESPWLYTGIFIGGLLVPEALVLWAAAEYLKAEVDVSYMQKKGVAQWTRKHAIFAGMGGFRLRDGTVVKSGEKLYEVTRSDPTHSLALERLDYQSILVDIDDKSKANRVTKVLAVLQISRYLVQTIVRAVQHLPISPMEYVTCTYVVCAILCYALWLNKPYGVREALDLHHYLKGPDSGSIEDTQRPPRRDIPFSTRVPVREYSDTHRSTFRLLTDTLDWRFVIACVATLFAGFTLGAGHLASWNVGFTNSGVQVLWRGCGVFVTATGPVCLVLGPWVNKGSYRGIIVAFILSVVVMLFIISRLVLLILVICTFVSLPAGMYDIRDIPWLHFIPFLH